VQVGGRAGAMASQLLLRRLSTAAFPRPGRSSAPPTEHDAEQGPAAGPRDKGPAAHRTRGPSSGPAFFRPAARQGFLCAGAGGRPPGGVTRAPPGVSGVAWGARGRVGRGALDTN
jgi:hypothetical protein